jgi:RNA polymerase sigma factor (sigma-70 family)
MSLPSPNSPPDLEALLAHSGWVRKLARAMASGKEFADDTEQEAWRIAMERPPTHGSNLKAWWKSVVRSAAYQRGRSEGRHQRRVERVAQTRPSRGVEEPYQVAERLETIQNLARLVQELEEPYGSSIYAHYFEGVSVAALAKLQGVSKSTIQSRLQRGVARLRTRMKGIHGDSWRSQCLALAFPTTSVPAALSLIPITLMNTPFKVALSVVALAAIGVFTVWNPLSADPPPVQLEAQLANSTPPVDSEPNPTEPNELGRRTLVTDGHQEPKSSRFDLPEGKKRDSWLEFKMLDAQGKPWPDLPIFIWGYTSYATSTNNFKTDKNGILRIPCLSGKWEFLLRSDLDQGGNGYFLSQDVDLLPGETLSFSHKHPGWSQFSGWVRDAKDEPIEGAAIEFRDVNDDRDMRISTEKTTGKNGDFEFRGMEGRFSVIIDPAGLPKLAAGGLSKPGQDVPKIHLQYPPCREILLEVLASDGSPMVGAKVEYENWPGIIVEEKEEYSSYYARQRHGQTDLEGKIAVPAQTDLAWPILLKHPVWGKLQIEIPPNVKHYTYRMPEGNTLRGQVVGPDGKPIAGAKIRGWGPDDSPIKKGDLPGKTWAYPGSPWKQTISDSQGKFILTGLQQSTLGILFVEAPGMAYFTQKGVVFPGSVDGMEIRLEKESPLAGQLLDHDETPIVGRRIVIRGQPQFGLLEDVFPEERNEKNNSWMAKTEQLRTDQNGKFSFPGLGPGLWTIDVNDVGGMESVAVVQVEAGTTDLVIHPGDGFEDKLNITGLVIHAETREPLHRFGYSLVSKGPSVQRNGDFTLRNTRDNFRSFGNPAGDYVLEVSAPGFAEWRTLILEQTGRFHFQVEMVPIFPIVLQVMDEEGQLVAGIPVQVFSHEGEPIDYKGYSFYARKLLGQVFQPEAQRKRYSTDDAGQRAIEGIPYQGGYFLVGGDLGLPGSELAIKPPSLEIPFHYLPTESSKPRVITLPNEFVQRWRASADR